MSQRESTLYYVGEPGLYIAGVPRRDLEERDIARLSDDQYQDSTHKGPNGKPLYQKTKPASQQEADQGDHETKKREAAKAKRRQRAAERKAEKQAALADVEPPEVSPDPPPGGEDAPETNE